MNKKTMRIVAPVILVALIILGGVLIHWNNNRMQVEAENNLLMQKIQIEYILDNADQEFKEGILLSEQKDSQGNPFYVGVLSDEIDAVLDDLVEAYNSDSAVTEFLVADELRYSLTEGLMDLASDDGGPSQIIGFLIWTDTSVDLVYAGDMPDAGIISGSTVDSSYISNYEYYSNRSNFPIYTPRSAYVAD